MDWRDSYHDGVRMHVDDFRAQRARGADWLYNVPGHRRMLNVRHMSDAQISTLARKEAEFDMNRAINQWNETHA